MGRMRYQDGSMPKSFDRIADKFDETRSLPDEVMARVVDTMGASMTPGAKVLDAGVGTGRFALPLQDRGFDVVGVDVSVRMMEKAVSKGVRGLVRSDVCALPFRDKAFDYAVSVHLIHLVKEWRCALSEIGRVTRKDLVSVVTMKEDSASEEVRNVYRDACKRLGYEVRHVAPGERELRDLVPPDSSFSLGPHERVLDIPNMLDRFESRSLSEQWEVPEDVHVGAVEALRREYGDVRELVSREELLLVRWDADRIRGATESTR